MTTELWNSLKRSLILSRVIQQTAYLDICDDTHYATRAKSYMNKALEANIPAITTGGIYPGVSNGTIRLCYNCLFSWQKKCLLKFSLFCSLIFFIKALLLCPSFQTNTAIRVRVTLKRFLALTFSFLIEEILALVILIRRASFCFFLIYFTNDK